MINANLKNKIINKMKLVKRDEFEILKKIVQKLTIENEKRRKKSKKPNKIVTNILFFFEHKKIDIEIIK